MSSNSRQPELQNEAAAIPEPDRPQQDFGNVQPPDADRSEQSAAVEVQPINAAPSNEDAERDDPKMRKAEENLDLTMKEFLNVVKNDGDAAEVHTPLDSEPNSEQQIEKNNAVIEMINSVTGLDEEGRSRQRILTFAAKRYSAALERNPDDYDAFYNWALVLQESADNVSMESRSPSKDDLLKEACKMYDEATRLCPTLNDAYYNWAIAISDRAKIRSRTKEAEELWKEATKKYEKAVQLNWNNPQALNNWGLALQELSTIVLASEKQTVIKTAISKFRAAIRLQFDFHRAIYNLGTVLYGLAEDITRTKGNTNTRDVSPDELYSQSAIYIAAAHSLKPNYSVYSNALILVRSMLPLPHLKVGYLIAPPVGNLVAPHRAWQRSQFVLNHGALQQVDNINQTSSTSEDSPTSKPFIRVNIPDIVSVSPSSDLTLPPGAGLCIDTIQGTVLLIAESWECLERWLDAIRLVYTIFTRGKSDVLASIITT